MTTYQVAGILITSSTAALGLAVIASLALVAAFADLFSRRKVSKTCLKGSRARIGGVLKEAIMSVFTALKTIENKLTSFHSVENTVTAAIKDGTNITSSVVSKVSAHTVIVEGVLVAAFIGAGIDCLLHPTVILAALVAIAGVVFLASKAMSSKLF